MKVFGGRFAWLLRGHSSLRTDRRATGLYRAIDPQGLRTSMLATTRILAFFVSHPPPLTLPWRPHCHLGIYWCQRSQATRAATPPHRLRQWKHGRWLIGGIDFLDGFGFPISLYSSDFHCLILVIISMYLFGFGKLALRPQDSNRLTYYYIPSLRPRCYRLGERYRRPEP